MRKYFVFLLFLTVVGAVLNVQAFADNIWTVDFAINNPPADISVSYQYCWDIGNHLEFYSPDSLLTLTFNLKNKDYISYKLKVTDRGTNIRMAKAASDKDDIYSPLMIVVNNTTVANNIDVTWTDDATNVYEIGEFIKAGSNTIILDNAQDSGTRYDVRKIELIAN